MVSDAVRVRLGSHLRVPLFRDAYALILGSGITAVIGLAYWIVAAHSYPPATVGLNSAAISAMMLIAGLAQLNLTSALIRFVPTAGRSTRRLIAGSYLASFAVAAAAATVFLLHVRTWTPNLAFLASNGWFEAWFVAATIGWCAYLLQDAALTGLRRAVWVPVDGTIFSGAKVALLLGFALLFPTYGIFASWTLGTALAVVPITSLIFLRFVPGHVRQTRPGPAPVTVGRLARYASIDYLGSLAFLASSTLVPLIVTQRAGTAANAYFSLGWVMIVPLYFVATNMGSSMIVTAAGDEEQLWTYTYRAFVQALRLAVPAVAVLAVGAPYFLRLFGSDYARQGTGSLRLLALSALPNVVNTLFVCTCRVRRKMWGVVAVLGTQCALVLGLSWWFLGPYGITGVGLAWLIAQSAVAAAVLVRVAPVLARSGARRAPFPGEEARAAGPPAPPLALTLARNVAADLRVLPLLRAAPGRVRRRRSARDAAGVVEEALACGGLENRGWRLRRVAPSLSDTIVALVGRPGEDPEAVVKVADTARGDRSLRREVENLTALATDARLADWSRALPEVHAQGECTCGAFLVEGLVAGVDAGRLLATPAARRRVLRAAAGAVGVLHRKTGRSPAPLDDAALDVLVEGPAEVLRDRTGAEAWRAQALERACDLLRRRLAGVPLTRAWVHGDFVPANVFVAGDHASVTGIVDWELARSDGLPVVDVLQLLLATRVAVRRRELGQIVCGLLHEPRLDEHERELLHGALGAGVDLRALVLLAWLDHVAGVLDKSERYARSRVWQRLNVDAVLLEAARG